MDEDEVNSFVELETVDISKKHLVQSDKKCGRCH